MRIAMVSPYAWDVPGGVQIHIRDLAEHFEAQGHHVRVLAPTTQVPREPYVESAGGVVPVRYNGSVARLGFGPSTSAKVSRWFELNRFDVVHVHEPAVPSVSLLALRASEAPVVATFHTSMGRSRAMQMAHPMLRPSLERIRGRIAVSAEARDTVIRHLGGDPVIVPNGVCVAHFADAPTSPQWRGTPRRPTIAFLGRVDEPRKGLAVLVDAIPAIQARIPGVRVLVAGPGNPAESLKGHPAATLNALEFLGPVTEDEKRSLLASVDAYAAPHTGGESFGIVLVEAMAAGAPVVATELPAFLDVLGGGRAGVTVPVGSPAGLADGLLSVLTDSVTAHRFSTLGAERAASFDWSMVASRVMNVYETVIEGALMEPELTWRSSWSPMVRPVTSVVRNRR